MSSAGMAMMYQVCAAVAMLSMPRRGLRRLLHLVLLVVRCGNSEADTQWNCRVDEGMSLFHGHMQQKSATRCFLF